jgi:hypothetical protein
MLLNACLFELRLINSKLTLSSADSVYLILLLAVLSDYRSSTYLRHVVLSDYQRIIYTSVALRALVDLGHFFSFLIYTQSTRLLGRGISPSQGRYLHTEQRKQRVNAHTDIHSSSGIRTHDTSVWAGEDGWCLRPRGNCDRLTRGLLLWGFCCSPHRALQEYGKMKAKAHAWSISAVDGGEWQALTRGHTPDVGMVVNAEVPAPVARPVASHFTHWATRLYPRG